MVKATKLRERVSQTKRSSMFERAEKLMKPEQGERAKIKKKPRP